MLDLRCPLSSGFNHSSLDSFMPIIYYIYIRCCVPRCLLASAFKRRCLAQSSMMVSACRRLNHGVLYFI